MRATACASLTSRHPGTSLLLGVVIAACLFSAESADAQRVEPSGAVLALHDSPQVSGIASVPLAVDRCLPELSPLAAPGLGAVVGLAMMPVNLVLFPRAWERASRYSLVASMSYTTAVGLVRALHPSCLDTHAYLYVIPVALSAAYIGSR